MGQAALGDRFMHDTDAGRGGPDDRVASFSMGLVRSAACDPVSHAVKRFIFYS
jgi:hypothetical protein